MDEFLCPKCGGNACKRWALPNLMLVHWLLNPALVVNEIVLGQRVPRTTYFCIKCDAPLFLRQYVRCSACGKFHHGLLWGRGNALGHWFGMFCPACGGRIPVLLNSFSLLIIVATCVLWYPLWLMFRVRWIAWEQRRAARQRSRGAGQREPIKRWVLYGAVTFGLFMWAFDGVPRYLAGPERGNLTTLLLKLPIWLGAGALFGFIMKWILGRRHNFKPGHCRACGYDLRGLPDNVCPECGFRFDSADLRRPDATDDRSE